MRESSIQNDLRLKISQSCPGVVFRTNAGEAWQGEKVWSHEFNQYVLVNMRPYKGLPKGFSDLLYIGPAADTAFLEVKNEKGKTSKEQDNFLALMRKFGHSTAVVRSADEAVAFLNNPDRLKR